MRVMITLLMRYSQKLGIFYFGLELGRGNSHKGLAGWATGDHQLVIDRL